MILSKSSSKQSVRVIIQEYKLSHVKDKTSLLATALLAAFFFTTGMLDLLDNFIVMMVLFLGFIGILVNIIIVKSKDDNNKNLP